MAGTGTPACTASDTVLRQAGTQAFPLSVEIRIEQQVAQRRILVERLLDSAEKCRTDDTAAAPTTQRMPP
jgi:hypothetical protein